MRAAGGGDRSARASVDTVDGTLFKITSAGLVPVSAGTALADGEKVRAAKATYAVLKLGDGTRIEMNDRAELAVSVTWRGTTALDSPREKNQELKSVLIEETPWLRQATSESEARRNVGQGAEGAPAARNGGAEPATPSAASHSRKARTERQPAHADA